MLSVRSGGKAPKATEQGGCGFVLVEETHAENADAVMSLTEGAGDGEGKGGRSASPESGLGSLLGLLEDPSRGAHGMTHPRPQAGELFPPPVLHLPRSAPSSEHSLPLRSQ